MPDAHILERSRGRSRRQALLLFGLGLVLSGLLGFAQSASNSAVDLSRFQREASRIHERLIERMHTYELGLRGARGVALTAGEQLTRRQFAVYAQSRDLAREFPGSRGFGLGFRVEPQDEERFVAHAQLDQPYFALKQLEHHAGTRWIILHAEPEIPNRQALGFDVASEPKRLDALQRAIRTGQTSLTAPIRLVTEPGRGDLGLLLFLPLYDGDRVRTTPAERERAARGFAYTPLMIDEVLSSLEPTQDLLQVAITDGSPHGAPFFGTVRSEPETRLRDQRDHDVFGRTWRVSVVATSRFVSELHLASPSLSFVLGAMVSGLLAGLLHLALIANMRKQLARVRQEQLSNLVDNMSDAVVSEGLDGCVTHWNRAAEQIFGYSAREAVGKRREDLGLGRLEDREGSTIARARAGERVGSFRALGTARDGSEHVLSISPGPIRSLTGAIVGIALTIRDVTQRHAAEREREEQSLHLERLVEERTREIDDSRRRLRAALRDNEALLDTLHRYSLISITNRAGIIVDVNEQFCRVSGYTREELLGERHNIINSGTHPRAFWVDMWRTISAGSPWRGQVCNRAKDGSLYYVDSMIAPLYDAQGNIDRYVSIRNDITARITATLDLAHERERLANILRGTNAGTWEWNVQTGETRVNDRWAQIIGYELHELESTRIDSWLALTHPEDLPHVKRQLRAHFMGDLAYYESEYRMRHRDGSWTWALDRGAIVTRTSDGQPEWIYGTHMDVTARHNAEDALRQATAQAKAANAAKSEFLANVSHEIRTPLNAVIGLSYLLERTQLNREQADYLSKIHSSGRHLLAVINDVLDLSKIEAGELMLEDRAFELSDVLAQLRQMMTPQAAGKQLCLIIPEAPSHARSLRGDATRLNQILTNLLSNAIKFTQRGKVELSLAATPNDDGSVALRCSVRDTGVGIPLEVQERLFTPFTQADASTTRRFGGTGLGLSIVRRLCQMMGGDVSVNSRPGEGSEFKVEVRLGVGSAAEAAGAQPFELLIAHGDTEACATLHRLAEELGWRASSAASVQEFRARVRGQAQEAHPLDLLILPALLDGEAPEGLCAAMREELAPELVPAVLVVAPSPAILDDREHELARCFTLPSTPAALFDAASAAMQRRFGNSDSLLRKTRLEVAPGQWLAGIRVLLVDDSELNIEVARAVLEREGARVTPASNGLEALELLRRSDPPFDLIMMDIQMPVMDGNEATRRIREELGLASIPIVALTAGALLAERQRAIAAGVNDFLTKPFDPSALVRSVRLHVEQARGSPLPVRIRPSSLPAPALEWQAIEGLDMTLAARRTMHNWELFQSMLRRLLNEYRAFEIAPPALPRDEGARTDLRQRMHKLRGSAGMLGATKLQHTAAKIEDALSDGNDPLDAELAMVHTCLVEIASSAREVLIEAPLPSSTPDLAAVRCDLEALRRLRRSLADNDLEALPQFQAQRQALAASLPATRFDALHSAIDDLRFADALALLDEFTTNGLERAS